MKFRTALVVGATLIGAGAASFFSCGRIDTGTDGSAAKEQPATDQPFQLAIGGASLEVPGGAFDADTKVQIVTGATPSLFVGQAATAPAANLAAEIRAETGSGGAVGEAHLPLTVTLTVDEIAAQMGVEAKADELCVFAQTQAGKGLVWRREALTSFVAETKQVTFQTRWLGVFQLYYCGLSPLAKMVDVELTGDELAFGGAESFGACDRRSITGPDAGVCYAYTGQIFSAASTLAYSKSACGQAGASFLDNATCPRTAALGDCVIAGTTTSEVIWTFYATAERTDSLAAEVSCDDKQGTWHASGTFAAAQNLEAAD